MAQGRFATAITCMDGRVQEPVSHWLEERYHVDFVDMITEPGVDRLFTFGPQETVDQIKAKVHISCSSHGSGVVAIAGHAGCTGNAVSDDAHREQIRAAVTAIRSWSLPAEVIGLWVNENWQVEAVQ
jgi:carbonic anhydrase